jgi:queuine tRNA-ribosyltransferase
MQRDVTQSFAFSLKARDGQARRGEIATPPGTIRTPAFMPVGTAATVKAMLPEMVRSAGADIVLANTYHLMLRPGAERIAKLGGLHRFMHWEGPILTDSGGYQVMSLAKLRRIADSGVTFQSHVDGATVELTPERAIEVQCLLGADIQMVLDECTPFPATRDEAKASMELSLSWAECSKQAFRAMSAPGQALFGIVQGSGAARHRLRRLCCRRPRGGRRPRHDARLGHRVDSGAARGPSPLPNGRRHAAGHARGDRPRH